MTKIITFSRNFPSYHPKAGQPTYFVEKILKSINPTKIQSKLIIQDALNIFSSEIYFSCNPKKHTIRNGNRWKVGDRFSPRVWSGKPYNSKQIILYEDVEIKNVYDFEFFLDKEERIFNFSINGKKRNCDYRVIKFNGKFVSCHFHYLLGEIAENDGLEIMDFMDWFKYPKNFKGQIICWNDAVSY